MPATNWQTFAESQFPWEADALNFVRERLPGHSPWQAWSNFEFLADDGSVNEVDLMVFGKGGWFLIEIKGHGGTLTGDEPRGWRLTGDDGRTRPFENPLFLLNNKAKRLKSLLERRQTSADRQQRMPFLDTLVFFSNPHLDVRLGEHARPHVVGPDTIMRALSHREVLGLRPADPRKHDKKALKKIVRLLDKAKVRPSSKHRRVGDYELTDLLREGQGWQDFTVKNTALKSEKPRLARIYHVTQEADLDRREQLRRAAEREYNLLEGLRHRGIQRVYSFTGQCELGPALIFEHRPAAVTLAAWWRQRVAGEKAGPSGGGVGAGLTDDVRLNLLRQLGEAMKFAHGRRVFHRALNPYAVLVEEDAAGRPRVLIRDWQAGARRGRGDGSGSDPRSGSSSAPGTSVSPTLAGTLHAADLTDETGRAYLAPELAAGSVAALGGDVAGVAQDVFALGAIAFELFAEQAPAESHDALIARVREHSGLSVAGVRNGTVNEVEELVQLATDPLPGQRYESIAQFLKQLDEIEDALSRPANHYEGVPGDAPKGTLLEGGMEVIRRLGSGSNAVALLVRHDGHERVFKVARENTAKGNARIRHEAEALEKLADSKRFVRVHGLREIGGYQGVLMDVAGGKDGVSLHERIRSTGISVDLLQRLGGNLIEAVGVLEDRGLAHRDIKPENIGFGRTDKSGEQSLILYDFSLSREDPANLRAGTPGFVDPFLAERARPRWDLHAERYAAAVTLYQMATGGSLPVWGDDATLPEMLPAAVDRPTLAAELFDAAVRESLQAYFNRALARDQAQRFDHAADMAKAWDRVFAGTVSRHDDPSLTDAERYARLDAATLDTAVADLGFSASGVAACDRADVTTAGELIKKGGFWIRRFAGVTADTRRELVAGYHRLRDRLGTPSDPGTSEVDADAAGLNTLAAALFKRPTGRGAAVRQATVAALFRLDDEDHAAEASDDAVDDPWPGQKAAALRADVTRGRISQILVAEVKKWNALPDVAVLRDVVADALGGAGEVMTADELAGALEARLGADGPPEHRARMARAVARLAVECEKAQAQPRFSLRRSVVEVPVSNGRAARTVNRAVVATDDGPARLAFELGNAADALVAPQRDGDAAPPGPEAAAASLRDAVNRGPQGAGLLDRWPLGDERLLRLAAAASVGAALSARRELYPVGLPAERAIRLAAGALQGADHLEPDDLRKRVAARYPRAEPLPAADDALDRLVVRSGVPWRLSETLTSAPGDTTSSDPATAESTSPASTGRPRRRFVPINRGALSIEGRPASRARQATASAHPASGKAGVSTPTHTPEVPLTPRVPADHREAAALDAKLDDLAKRGGTLYMTVPPHEYHSALRQLTRFNPAPVNAESVLFEAFAQAREADPKRNPPIDRVLAIDAAGRTGPRWNQLCQHVEQVAVPALIDAVLAAGAGSDTSPRPVLLHHPQWLARYGQDTVIATLREHVQSGALHGLWLLLPQTGSPRLAPGHAIEIVVPSEFTHPPDAWIANEHRAGAT